MKSVVLSHHFNNNIRGPATFPPVAIRIYPQKKYNIDVNTRAKAAMRLQTECEKLKKTMSANTTAIPLNIGKLEIPISLIYW